jgi:hypothetical protein
MKLRVAQPHVGDAVERGRRDDATECMPYEQPKLCAVAVGYLSGEDFAARLDRAIARSDRAELIGVETNLDQLTARLLAQVTQPNQKYD